MDFGSALIHLKHGDKMARKGWNGKGQYVRMVPDHFPMHPYFEICTVDSTFWTWVPSISDLFAEDWTVVVD